MHENHEARRRRRAAVAKELHEGKDLRATCKKYRVSYATASQACREFGVPWPCRPRRTNITFRVLADLLAGRITQTQIARKHDVSRQYISALVTQAREAGITIPKTGGMR